MDDPKVSIGTITGRYARAFLSYEKNNGDRTHRQALQSLIRNTAEFKKLEQEEQPALQAL